MQPDLLVVGCRGLGPFQRYAMLLSVYTVVGVVRLETSLLQFFFFPQFCSITI